MEPVITSSTQEEALTFRASGPGVPAVSDRQMVTTRTWRESVRTPHYFKRKARGEILPVNPLKEVKTRLLSRNGSMTAVHVSGGAPYQMEGNIPLFCAFGGKVPSWDIVPEPPLLDSSVANSLAVTAVSNARQELFDSLTFMAELEKTIEMLTGCVERYTTRLLIVDKHARVAWKSWKRGALAPKSSANFADFFSSCWMEWRYGITPLMFDIDALYKQLLELDALTHRVRGKAEPEPTISNVKSGVVSGYGFTAGGISASGGWLSKVKITRFQRVQPKAKALLELVSSFRCAVDPMLTAYEVIPYSWMFDWFVNVGELIRSFSPFQQGRVASCSASFLLEGIARYESLEPSSDMFIKLQSFTPSLFELRKTQHVRMAVSPQMELDFRIELSWRRILDLIALLFSRLAKVLRLIPQDATAFTWRHLRV